MRESNARSEHTPAHGDDISADAHPLGDRFGDDDPPRPSDVTCEACSGFLTEHTRGLCEACERRFYG